MPRTKSKTKYPEIDDIREDLNSLRDNVVELTKHIKKDGTNQSEQLIDMAADRLDTIKESGQKQVKNLKLTGKKQMKNVERHVKDKPAESVAIAFAAGLVASYLFGRR